MTLISSPWRSHLRAVGSYLPAQVMRNDELATRVDTSDEWIVSRSGIRQRHIAAAGEYTSDLATAAAQTALARAGLSAQDVDIIVLATATPDETFPATAARVQAKLGMTRGCAFDVQAVCSGFIYALTIADNFLRLGQARTALVIGAETFSRILDWEDRTTCVLFGDGAGAVVLQAEAGTGAADEPGIITTKLHSDGRHHDLLYVDGGPSSTGTVGKLRMQGKEVFRHAVTNLANVVQDVLSQAHLVADDIDWVIPHQANKRILDGTATKLNLAKDKLVITVDRHANTSAASVPLALDVAVGDGRVKRGDLLLLEAMGAGFTWGAALARW